MRGSLVGEINEKYKKLGKWRISNSGHDFNSIEKNKIANRLLDY